MSQLATYTCDGRHLDGRRPFPYVSTGGHPGIVFDTQHVMKDADGRWYQPNATEEQRRAWLLGYGWVYEVVERWGPGRFEGRRGWLCPWHAQPDNRGKVAGA